MAAVVWMLVLLVAAVAANEEWENCKPCRCSWTNSLKTADCKLTQGTMLTAIPGNLSSEIRFVDFTGQPFYELTKNIFSNNNLRDLQNIKLINCKLMFIDKLAFANMQLLTELDMSKNNIKKLDPNVFRDTKRLRVVILNDNELEILPDDLFSNLTQLRTVELDNNRIATIGKFTFLNTPALQYITMNSNLLKFMDISIIQSIQKLSSLGLHNNSWICDCHLKTLRDYTVKEKLLALPTECANPEGLKGRIWSDLTSEDFACKPKIIHPPDSEERNMTLNYLPLPPRAASLDTWALVLFIVLGLMVLALLLTGLLWCCVCRKRHPRHTKGISSSLTEDISLDYTDAEMEKSLITAVNPVEKPPRQYPPSVASGVTDVSEVKRTLLDNDYVFPSGDDESRSFDYVDPVNSLDVQSIRSDQRPYPPDLLAFGARVLQMSRAGSSASTVTDGSRLPAQHGLQTPIHNSMFDAPGLYRTLPYSRSHSPFISPLGGPSAMPRSAIKGYITMPRRTRIPSWSSAPPMAAEPVYDNLGLRTTATGNSMHSLTETIADGDVGLPRTPLNMDTRRLSAASLPCVPEERKVPPRPPPKPKKSGTTGPLFEDEGEDGTEI